MGSTKVNGIPYPEQTQQPLIPSDLATALEYAARSGVMRFANSAARTAYFSGLGISPSEGMWSDLADVDEFARWDGKLWRPSWVAAELRQTSNQNIASASWAPLNFDAHDLDSHSGHSDSVNNSRYVAPYTAWYLCSGGYTPASNTTGVRGTRWAVNGTAVNASQIFLLASGAGGDGFPARMKQVFLNAGDYLELQVWQNGVNPLGTQTTGEAASSMSVLLTRHV